MQLQVRAAGRAQAGAAAAGEMQMGNPGQGGRRRDAMLRVVEGGAAPPVPNGAAQEAQRLSLPTPRPLPPLLPHPRLTLRPWYFSMAYFPSSVANGSTL
jgi:hypothetical protein